MDFIFDLLQGAGIAAAIGIRPLLPVLLVGALASADIAVDFDGTDFAFLESSGMLIGIIALVALTDVVRRRMGEDAMETGPALIGMGLLAVVLGAGEAAGALANGGHAIAPGLAAGAIFALLGLAASSALFGRVRARLDADAAGYLPLYRESFALVAAGLSIAFPPFAIVVIGVLVWLLRGGRRRDGEKYAGLRILR